MNEKILLIFIPIIFGIIVSIVVFFVVRRINSKKIKPRFMTIAEIQEKMRRGEPMPTAVFSARKKEYIVKARTIYAKEKKASKAAIKW